MRGAVGGAETEGERVGGGVIPYHTGSMRYLISLPTERLDHWWAGSPGTYLTVINIFGRAEWIEAIVNEPKKNS